MVAVRNLNKKLPKIPAKKIPASLIYEVIDGKPIYYKGYREVLGGTKKSSEIMGASTLQNMIIQYMLRILFRNLDEKKYHILTNEQGLHLEKKTNLSADIAIFETSKLPLKAADKHYASVPPKIQIEVDIDADIENFEFPEAYINLKTDKLLAFGVEKVIWVISESKKVMIATKDENWQIANWHQDIEVIEGISFNIGQYLQEGESPYA
ncbi:Uma2 family endonuclease [Emticicia sp. W12TSBA100-4]|uniref:Uma2 family endonuclease n=1 Tax=Emticicia sp. W12TSBA100-4 TaxID=3160965 RepID=UPI0033068FB6